MKVKCIDDTGFESQLTKEKEYSASDVIHESNSYFLRNDRGIGAYFKKSRFEVIEDNYFGKASIEQARKEDKIIQGIKHDQEKLKPTLLFDDMPLAIQEVLKVLKFGADKYGEGNWLKVEDGIKRYRNASDRHRLQGSIEELDSESGLLHLAHETVNTLMLLELKLRK